MDIQSVIYFMFAAVLLASAIAVVTVPNPVHSALYLIVSFFSAAGIWIMLQAEFLGILLILVYVGAVMVLFLFVVMMLNLNTTRKREGFKKTLALAVGLGVLVVVQMGSVIFHQLHRPAVATAAADLSIEGSNTRKIGKVLFTEYALPFELAALILLVALVAAVVITLRNRKESKVQNPSKQAQTRAKDRLSVVNQPADVAARQTVSAIPTNTQEL
ncbi:MAG: NADH-quinone oxidoreductase subunit J [Burkholderiales bacterium]|jgi:NADH-quinone oxidoreductase subunit J|nr:NADH-quinone oxidoreductase subunit J [Burkholderiales bacterium]MCE1176208.1 NADH-quinone oxidoreductase subunit J [Burkholderiales bacterium]